MSLREATGMDQSWDSGWFLPAVRLASPNHGQRPEGTDINLLVIHSISLPPGEFGNNNVQRLFTNQLDWNQHPYFQSISGIRVSSHFFICRTGELWQFVSCDDRAWHAGQSSFCGTDNCNDYSVGIELEGLEGCMFEPHQYQVLTDLCLALIQHYPIAHIAGHEHIAPGRKQDPGSGFDWALLQHTFVNMGAGRIVFPSKNATKGSDSC